MGRRKERTGFGRRQVLQLHNSNREDSPYRGQGGQWPIRNEGNALSGLMAHYGESDVSEEEEEETPPHVPEEPPPEELSKPDEFPEPPETPPTAKENGHTTAPENKGNISLDIDSKVANFLAEIDALDSEKPDDIDGEPMPDVEMEDAMAEPPPLPEKEPVEEVSEKGTDTDTSESDKEEAPEPPKAPMTVWQHCQDENTQYFYYWNTTTNEVTWEIPQEYSQYLLQLKEHEEAMARYEVKKAEYEAAEKESKKSKKKSKGSRRVKVEDVAPIPPSNEEEPPPHRIEKKAIKPWLLKKIRETYGDKYDTSETEEEKPPLPSEPEIQAEIGPQLPSNLATDELRNEIGPQLPSVNHDEDSGEEMIGPLPERTYTASLPIAQQAFAANLVSVADAEDDVLIGPMPLQEVGDDDRMASPLSEDHNVKAYNEELSIKRSYDSDSDEDSEDSPRNSISAEPETFIGPQLPASILEKREEKEQEVVEEEEMEEEEEDLDFIDKQLEEPYMAMSDKKKKVKKQPELPPPTSPTPVAATKTEEEEEEDVEFDIDDIDQQLDMALEKKTAEQQTEKEPSMASGKRKFTSDIETDKKRSKLSYETSESTTTPKKKIDKEEIKMKAEVADLSTLITDKLEFLEVTRKGLSKLQILLIETETRISDWREGALSTRYLLGRLQDAELQLQQYESSAAPSGWACHWDRTYKRYFYFHTTTGASQWDYPDDDGSKDSLKTDATGSTLLDPTAMTSEKTDAVTSTQASGEGALGKEPILPQYAQVDSTTYSADTTQASSAMVSSSVTPSQTKTSVETSSSSTEGASGSKTSFPVDPSLFQDLFAPAPPPPSEPPPPGVEAAPPVLGPPRPPPGLPNSIPLSRSPPPPPPGTTPPHAATTTTAAEDSETTEVATIDPTTTSLLAAAPPPPPPPEDVTTSTINPGNDQYNYSSVVMGSAYLSNLPSGSPLPVPPAVVNPSTIIAQPVISSMPAVSSSTTTVAPPTPYMQNQPGSAQCTPPDTPPRTSSHVTYDSSLDGIPLAEPVTAQQTTTALSSSSSSSSSQQQSKERKRKKEKKSSMGLSLKKKKLPSLVAKWQEVHQAVEREVSKQHKEEDSP